MDAKSDTADAAVARIAAQQHGVVTRRQLEACGLGSKAITIRVRKGQLHRVHQGVYTMGHPPLSHHQRFMAAVLACGEEAVLSHASAAVLWELLKPISGPVHVSIAATSGRRSRHGIRIHRCPSLQTPREPSPSPSSSASEGGRGRRLLASRRHDIPVTTIPRTIDDLEGTVAPYLFRRAKRQAEHKGVHLEGVESKRQRSDLEEDFLALFLAHRFPHPETNVKVGRHEVDFLWRPRKLVVEVDTFLYHRGSVSFESDHARDLDQRQCGFTVLRYTDVQLESESERIVADVAAGLREALP